MIATPTPTPTSVKFLLLQGDHTCSFEKCIDPKSGNFVRHEDGLGHPMHIKCALRMIQDQDQEKCTYCLRSVEGSSLRVLATRDTKVIEAPKSPAASPCVTEKDEAYAFQLQKEFDLEVEQLNEQDELSGAVALSLEVQSRSGKSEVKHRAPNGAGADAFDPTAFDGIIAEGLQAEAQLKLLRLQNAPPSQAVVAMERGGQGIGCGKITKAAVGVVGLAFTIGIVVKAMQGA